MTGVSARKKKLTLISPWWTSWFTSIGKSSVEGDITILWNIQYRSVYILFGIRYVYYIIQKGDYEIRIVD